MAKKTNRKGRRGPEQWDPVIVYSLTEAHDGFKQGFHYRVHDFDDTIGYFVTQERMTHFLTVHKMMPVSPERMTKLRIDQKRTIEA